jgi:ADP-ribosylglycohydrolase
MDRAVPVAGEGLGENWMQYIEAGNAFDEKLRSSWESVVPGSLAPCRLVLSAIIAMENKGYEVSAAEELYAEGEAALDSGDMVTLNKITARIYEALNNAPINEKSDYFRFEEYLSFEQVERDSDFHTYGKPYDIFSEDYEERIKSARVAQMIATAAGVQMEGYAYKNIKKAYGEITGYLRKPETYNDDLTYEIAFLEAFREHGYGVTSRDIALAWAGIIPDGYSAEEVALRNIRNGIMPPESGRLLNYYSDWIGAQMRSAIQGMVAPGNPRLAAELAWRDGIVSHANNGVIGGIFNAVLASLAFVEKDIRKIIMDTVAMLPKRSQYASVAAEVLQRCRQAECWEDPWLWCENRFKTYHWIHAYPNLAAEIVALWFGDGDFDKTLNIICLAGKDTDCNAAQAMSVLGIVGGSGLIDEKWIAPLENTVHTLLRKYRVFTIDELGRDTVDAARNGHRKLAHE